MYLTSKNVPAFVLAYVCAAGPFAYAQLPDSLAALTSDKGPQSFEEMWAGFDPRDEPLETKVLKEWKEEGVVLRIVRFRIGVFKGKKATLAAIYGFPVDAANNKTKLPGLVQIHGGGQYADHKACLANAKRGYATVSIAWAGRISAPEYRVSPAEVKLFWDGKVDDPAYRLTTDWGAVDGYHAPSRNTGNQFPSATSAAWTLDSVESPRNSGWFLCALAARRALTFLERQPEVDPERLGVYGHSMGGKLTVMASVDPRVKAAAPSCGGISDRDNVSSVFRATIGDDVSLKQVSCPIIFQSPANDFHGRIGDLPRSIEEIQSKDWRVTCSPHHNHQDTAPYEVASLLWFDQHLKGTFTFPKTPETTLKLDTGDGVPVFSVTPDPAKRILSVDIFYTQDGKADEQPKDMQDVIHRYWKHAESKESSGVWTAQLSISDADRPLWAYANIHYALDETVAGAGYYYGIYNADSFNLSSILTMISAQQLRESGTRTERTPSLVIEDFQGEWQKEWFGYRSNLWERSMYKLADENLKAPPGARLSLTVQSAKPNTLVVLIDDFAAETQLTGGDQSQQVILTASDFRNLAGETLPDWQNVRMLKLTHQTQLRPRRGQQAKPQVVGKPWNGAPPIFSDLRWLKSYSFLDFPRGSAAKADYVWTTNHMHVGVRWQPFIGLPQANAYDATRPVIARDSSYVQFWVAWSAMEPTEANRDYKNNPSSGLQAIEQAVDVCNARGIKVEFVFFHCPAWASIEGRAGGFKPKPGLFEGYVNRIARYFKGRVDAYQLTHEANLQGLMRGADIEFVINDIILRGAETIRAVYDAEPSRSVLVSTTGMSPCAGCETTKGLDGKGGTAVNQFYDLMVGDPDLMHVVDALNLNVSDHASGYGRIDDVIPSVWDQFDLVRRKLDEAEYSSKSVLSAESWIVWDNAGNARDINGDGEKNEQDAYLKAVTIMGQCLQRGLNTVNLPWSDNSSSWAMGLTKRRDYNGRVGEIRPDIVVPAIDGGPAIVTRKVGLRGHDDNFEIVDGAGNVFTIDQYINPPDPNHLHYYIWRWYAQIAAGSDEVIRHAIAGESGNDITLSGAAFTGDEHYRIASYNRTRNSFMVLLYASGANGQAASTVSIPSTIRNGRHYNSDVSRGDFRGEGFSDGETYYARIITKNISIEDGSDVNASYFESDATTATNETLTVTIPKTNRFTAIEFISIDN